MQPTPGVRYLLTLRVWCRRCRSRGPRRLLRLTTRGDALELLDLLHVRHQHRVRRIQGELRPDGVRLPADEGELLTANEVGSLDAAHERASLAGGRVPAVRFVLYLTQVVQRLSDGLRHVIEHADHVDRRGDDFRWLVAEPLF